MAKELRGEISKKLWKKLKDAADDADQKWSRFADDLLELASKKPGKHLVDIDKKEKVKPVRLKPKKKTKKAAQRFMEAHDLNRKEVLGYALARGWELYND
jgi:hypothetical protein